MSRGLIDTFNGRSTCRVQYKVIKASGQCIMLVMNN